MNNCAYFAENLSNLSQLKVLTS